jgi:hypothetical protein
MNLFPYFSSVLIIANDTYFIAFPQNHPLLKILLTDIVEVIGLLRKGHTLLGGNSVRATHRLLPLGTYKPATKQKFQHKSVMKKNIHIHRIHQSLHCIRCYYRNKWDYGQ